MKSYPCDLKGNRCKFCPEFADCQKAQGKAYRKWEKANIVINGFPDGGFEILRYKNDFDYMCEAGNLPTVDRVRKMIKDGPFWIPVDGFDIADLQSSIKNSSKRSKDTMYGYVLANDWQYFATFTFDPKYVDRSDDRAVKHLWSEFERYCKRRSPECKILAIPERHPTSGALHFHVLMSDITWTLTPAVNPKTGEIVTTKFGDPVFNVKDWEYGFSTVALIPPDNNNVRVANYLVKYITKDGNTDYNAKRYYRTRNLAFKNKVIAYLSDEEFAGSEFKDGIEQVKDNEKMTVYRYTPKKEQR